MLNPVPPSLPPELPPRVQQFDALPDSALVGVQELVALGLGSRATIWRDVHNKRLPPPIKIGPNRRGWLVGDVRQRLKGEE